MLYTQFTFSIIIYNIQYAKHFAFERDLLFTQVCCECIKTYSRDDHLYLCVMINQEDIPRLREQMLKELKSGELNL